MAALICYPPLLKQCRFLESTDLITLTFTMICAFFPGRADFFCFSFAAACRDRHAGHAAPTASIDKSMTASQPKNTSILEPATLW